ncbi:MAG: HlyC/CorC family transporter [Ruminococcaceae bacterium]|nr:HlyC/CorC family transporter [Oscillospiraceae bacterium]
MSIAVILPLMLILLMFSAFFSGSEIAYMSVNPRRLEKAGERSSAARLAFKLQSRFDKVLGPLLIGNNLVNTAASSVATVFVVAFFPGGVGATIATAAVTVLVLIFGEIIPKIVAKQIALTFVQAVAYPLQLIVWLLTPIAAPFVAVIHRIFRKNEEEPTVTEEELSTIIETVGEEGVLNEERSDLLQSALDFANTTVGEILTHRLKWDAIDINADPKEISAVISNTPYSRLPVYEHDFDHIIGVLNVKHYYRVLVEEGEITDLRAHLKEPSFVYTNMKLPAALAEMREEQNHVDFVLDEYGGIMGIVTMEDILEQLVGDIWDESDEIENEFVETDENTWEVLGDANVEDMFDMLDVDYRDFESDFTTVSGWAIEMLDADPHEGDSFAYRNLYVIVTEMGENRIERLSVVVNPISDEDEDE